MLTLSPTTGRTLTLVGPRSSIELPRASYPALAARASNDNVRDCTLCVPKTATMRHHVRVICAQCRV